MNSKFGYFEPAHIFIIKTLLSCNKWASQWNHSEMCLSTDCNVENVENVDLGKSASITAIPPNCIIFDRAGALVIWTLNIIWSYFILAKFMNEQLHYNVPFHCTNPLNEVHFFLVCFFKLWRYYSFSEVTISEKSTPSLDMFTLSTFKKRKFFNFIHFDGVYRIKMRVTWDMYRAMGFCGHIEEESIQSLRKPNIE